MAKIVMLSGKGGVGKTTIAALILDELARSGYRGRVLAVDGDPAMTLNIALNLPDPQKTVADVRNTANLSGKNLATIPEGVTREGYLKSRLIDEGVLTEHKLHDMPLTLMPMGRGEGRHCYCSVNKALSDALKEVIGDYDLIVIDNEAGLEHLSRYRINHADYFIVVAGPDKASRVVAQRILEVANEVEMVLRQVDIVINRCQNPLDNNMSVICLPYDSRLIIGNMAAIDTAFADPLRQSLQSIVNKIRGLIDVRQSVSPA